MQAITRQRDKWVRREVVGPVHNHQKKKEGGTGSWHSLWFVTRGRSRERRVGWPRRGLTQQRDGTGEREQRPDGRVQVPLHRLLHEDARRQQVRGDPAQSTIGSSSPCTWCRSDPGVRAVIRGWYRSVTTDQEGTSW